MVNTKASLCCSSVFTHNGTRKLKSVFCRFLILRIKHKRQTTLLANLSIAPLHVSQRHLWVDRMTAGHTEDLKVCVITITFSHLYRWRQTHQTDRETEITQSYSPFVSYILVVLDLLLFGDSNDPFKFVETFLHQCEAEPCRLLLLPDSLKLSPPHLLSNTWTLLPLLDPLREDLIDATEGLRQTNKYT